MGGVHDGKLGMPELVDAEAVPRDVHSVRRGRGVRLALPAVRSEPGGVTILNSNVLIHPVRNRAVTRPAIDDFYAEGVCTKLNNTLSDCDAQNPYIR